MTKAKPGHRPGRVPPCLTAAAAGVLGVVFAFGHADGYRFFRDGRTAEIEVRLPNAVRWSRGVWGPGDTLVWDITPDPLWEVYFGSPEGVIPLAERAMAAWEAIPTADISWRIAGVGEGPWTRMDDRNTIFLDPEADFCGGYAAGRAERPGSGARLRMESCDIALCSGFTEVPDDIEPERLDEHRQWVLEGAVSVLVHEFGHCLGLGHAGDLSATGRWHQRGDQWTLVHPRDPAMSYGYGHEHPDGVLADDMVGASLLRPRARWPDTTGSIAGVVSVDGEPTPYVHVWALPAGDRPLRDRIEVLSDSSGAFLIEGLVPGDYALWAQPVASQGANQWVIHEEGPIDLEDALRGSLVSVRAGQIAENIGISLRRGRAARPPPREAPPPRKRSSPTKGGVGPAEVCPGVQVVVQHPYPPDAPLWFTGRDFGIGRDRWWGTTVTVEWSAESEGVLLDWAGAYRNWRWTWEDDEEKSEFFGTVGEFEESLGARTSRLDVAISDYRIRKTAAGVRHTMEIAWPESTETIFRFRSEDDTCDGEPLVVCDLSGCELRR